MALSKPKRPLEFSSSGSEDGGQRQSKRQAPFTPNLQNHGINGSPGHFTLDDVRQVVREELRKQANSDQMELIDSRIQNALMGFIPHIDSSLKNAIREFVCKGTDHPNPHSFELLKRTLPERSQITDMRNMQLRFNSKLFLCVYTTIPLQKQLECPIQVELIDANTGRIVTTGPGSCAKLDVVVLRGDFNKEDNNTWSVEKFEECMVKERDEKQPLLTGKLQVKLKEGMGELGNLTFTDNSSWTPSKKFRIGVKVTSGFCEGIRVHEAITEAFRVKEYRGKANKKHNEPAVDDEIWRLEKIGKDGKYCKRLNDKGIHKVEDFARHLHGDPMKLREILKGMLNEKWNNLKNHAYKCVSDGKSYVYYCDDKKDNGVVISNLCQLKGFITVGVYHTTDQLSHSQKAHADNLVKAAINNWDRVTEVGAESLSSPMLSKSLSACKGGLRMNQHHYGDPSDCRLTPLSFPGTEDSKVILRSSVPVSGGPTIGFPDVNHNHSVGIAAQSLLLPRNTNLTTIIQENVSPSNQQGTSANENMFSDWLINSSPPNFMEDPLSISAYDNFGDLLGDLPEYVDLQNIFHNNEIGSSSNPYIGRKFTKGNGRGVVGWFKVKAILRWGLFVRKRVK